jgi:hypothetical protein
MDTEYRLSSKKVERNVLRVELPEDELWQNDRYQQLEQQIQELKKKVEDDFGFAEAEN